MASWSSVAVVTFALAVWTTVACALARRAQLRAIGDAAVPWLAIGLALSLVAAAIAARPLQQAATCGVACIALVIAADADARTGYLFDLVTLPTAGLVLTLSCFSGAALSSFSGCALLVIIFGCVVACSRGRAMGLGDVKAMASIGAAFGPAESMLAIAAACASGILEAGMRGRLRARAEIRFGPHLAIGAAVALVFGERFARYVIGG